MLFCGRVFHGREAATEKARSPKAEMQSSLRKTGTMGVKRKFVSGSKHPHRARPLPCWDGSGWRSPPPAAGARGHHPRKNFDWLIEYSLTPHPTQDLKSFGGRENLEIEIICKILQCSAFLAWKWFAMPSISVFKLFNNGNGVSTRSPRNDPCGKHLL